MSMPVTLRIDLECPECGHSQSEAAAVVSTFCRSCGAHIQLERRKKLFGLKEEVVVKATPPNQADDSGLGPVIVHGEERIPSSPRLKPWRPNPPRTTGDPHGDNLDDLGLGEVRELPPSSILTQITSNPPPTGKRTPESASDFDDLGLGEVKEIQGQAAPVARPPPRPRPTSTPLPTKGANGVEGDFDDLGLGEVKEIKPQKKTTEETSFLADLFGEPKTPAPPPVPRLTNRPSRYFREAVCFACGHNHQAGRNSKSSLCPACGEAINLSDLEIEDSHKEVILTRGNLVIHRTGFVKASRVHCHNMLLYGKVEAPVQCDGELAVMADAALAQTVGCASLKVDRNATLTITKPLQTAHAEIAGQVLGDIVCHGPLIIQNHGSVDGNVSAISVSIDPGGELLGSMNIIRRKS